MCRSLYPCEETDLFIFTYLLPLTKLYSAPVHVNVFPQTLPYILQIVDFQYYPNLVVEVIEKDISRYAPYLIELKKRGVKIALDDFGSGESNFCILDLPWDIVKVDVGSLKLTNPQSLIDLIKENHDYKIVAERSTPKEVKADYYQSFELHKPEPLSISLELYRKLLDC